MEQTRCRFAILHRATEATLKDGVGHPIDPVGMVPQNVFGKESAMHPVELFKNRQSQYDRLKVGQPHIDDCLPDRAGAHVIIYRIRDLQ